MGKVVGMTASQTVAEQLRAAIRADKRSLYQLAKDADIPYPSLHGFVQGKSLMLDTAEKLAVALGMKSLPLRR